MIGETVLHYRILRKLGSGGMGTVYEATDTALQRAVALKVLRPETAPDPIARERFLTEARAASSLDHPNVCTIYAIEGTPEGELLLAMALYRGRTLDRILQSGALPFSQVIDIAAQTCQALNAAHVAGIVHRDIKPSNILVCEDGTVKVLDFGLSKMANGRNLTAPNQVMGTLLYMSPEQLRGDVVDHRTDIWALGAVTYEMAAGHSPFDRVNSQEIMRAIHFEGHMPLREIRKDVPPVIEEVVMRALQKKPVDRYASATEMLQDLRDSAPAPSKSSTGIRSSSSITPPPIAAAIAVLPLQNLSADPENEYFSDGLTDELISALGRIRRLRVVSRSSVFELKGKAQDIRKVGEALNVDLVLEGSVRRAGLRVRVSLQLTNVHDGYQLWSERYDREMSDVFELQDEITQTVMDALKVHVSADITKARISHATENVDAYELYLKGRYHWNQKTPEAIQLAFRYFEQALVLDPDFALAHAGVADFYSLMASLWIMPADQAWPLAKASAQRALGLNDRLAQPHISLGLVLQFYEWKWREAEREIRRGIALRPQNGESYVYYAYHLMTQGQLRQALDQTRIGQQFDPLSIPLKCTEAMIRTYLGEHEAAIALALPTLESAPYFIELYYVLGIAYRGAGRLTKAREILERGAEATRRFPLLVGWLGSAYAEAGEVVKAEAVLQELLDQEKQSYAVPLALGVVYTALGRYDEAFRWLNRAADARDTLLCYVQVIPTFDPLRSDPRYGQLLDRMQFPRETEAVTAALEVNAANS